MIWWILMFAAIFLLCSNGEFKKQAFRVLDGAMRESLMVPSARKRPFLSPIMKKQVAAAQKWRCAACKKLLDGAYEIDHIVPLYKGGSNDRHNLQALHRACHMAKSAMDT